MAAFETDHSFIRGLTACVAGRRRRSVAHVMYSTCIVLFSVWKLCFFQANLITARGPIIHDAQGGLAMETERH